MPSSQKFRSTGAESPDQSLSNFDKKPLLHPYVFVYTTIDLPDETFRQLKAEAALSGVRLKELVTEFVEKGLASRAANRATSNQQRCRLPQVRPPSPTKHRALTNAELDDILTTADHLRPFEARQDFSSTSISSTTSGYWR